MDQVMNLSKINQTFFYLWQIGKLIDPDAEATIDTLGEDCPDCANFTVGQWEAVLSSDHKYIVLGHGRWIRNYPSEPDDYDVTEVTHLPTTKFPSQIAITFGKYMMEKAIETTVWQWEEMIFEDMLEAEYGPNELSRSRRSAAERSEGHP